jgi:hypothetical protein
MCVRFGSNFGDMCFSNNSATTCASAAASAMCVRFGSNFSSVRLGSNSATCDQRLGSSSALQQRAPRQQLGDM